MKALLAAASAAVLCLAAVPAAVAQDAANMSFFITSAGSGDGANLGGLEGADAICMKLAEAAGAERQDLAGLSQRRRRQRQGPHRRRALAELRRAS